MEGFKTYRHEINPREKELHDKFIKEHINKDTDFIVFRPANDTQTYAVDELSDREKQIMISTIQWLGSPVGTSFLRDCGFKKEEKWI